MIDFIKRDKPVVTPSYRIFASQPVTKTNEKKIVISYSDLNELKEEMITSIDLETDEEKKTMFKAEIENRFMNWYKNKDMKKDYRDFLVDETAVISTDVHVHEDGV